MTESRRARPDLVAAYQDELILALRWRDVRGDRIGEVLAEIESHTADSGESPYDAFGPPTAYAGEIADRLANTLSVVPLGWRNWLVAVAFGPAGFLLATGVWAVAADRSVLGVPGWLLVLVGVAAYLILWKALGDSRKGRIHDPRTGREWNLATPAWVGPVVIGLPLAMLVVSFILGLLVRGAPAP